ncbi:hypothetical protein M885DRAFT_545619 [Pelagophyceae sp. CCMP2097]|nr:hypothetical protein M885DRAFT_545619 [Pelagophyceae sp. CCMP2097]
MRSLRLLALLRWSAEALGGGARARPARAPAVACHAKRPLFSFEDGRNIARAHGFSSREEYDDYSCPGPYRPPRDPEAAYPADWVSWADWLGLPLGFDEARAAVRPLRLASAAAFADYVRVPAPANDGRAPSAARSSHGAGFKQRGGDVACPRLPAAPDVHYGAAWRGWADFLGLGD